MLPSAIEDSRPNGHTYSSAHSEKILPGRRSHTNKVSDSCLVRISHSWTVGNQKPI
jgi:hypothetical protein